jgi:hypothetical protein
MSDLLIRQIQPHKVQAQDPHVQRLVMAGKNRLGQVIKGPLASLAVIALAIGVRLISSLFRHLCALTPGAGYTIGPSHVTDGFITFGIIYQVANVQHLSRPSCLIPQANPAVTS